MEMGITLSIVAAIALFIFIMLIKSNTDIPPGAEVALDPDSDQFKREEFIAIVAQRRKINQENG